METHLMPKVSAIITTFNRSQFLKKAIESVLQQSVRDFELLVLDNSSTDETQQFVQGIRDPQLRYIRHSPLSISQARNLGIREAKAEFVAFLDDDDEWLKNKLEDQLEIFQRANSAVGLVYGGCQWVDERGKIMKTHFPVLRGKILRELLTQKDAFTGSASNPMIRKEVFDAIGGYNEKVLTGEDWEFYLRLAEKYEIEFTNSMVVNIRHHRGVRLGDKLKDAANLELMVLEKHKAIFEKDRKLKSFYLQKIGGKLCRVGEQKRGREYLAQAIKVFPLNFFACMQYIISFCGTSFYRSVHRFFKYVID